MAERIISERVIKSEVIKGQNPIFKRFSNLSSSIGGLCVAPIILILALGVLIWGENLKKDSAVVERLDLIDASEASGDQGLAKIKGVPEITNGILTTDENSALYFEEVREEYREVEEKETETVTVVENGQNVEKTIEKTKLVDKWVQSEKIEQWAKFELGEIEVKPDRAKLQFEFEEKMYLFGLSGELGEYPKEYSATLGDERITIKYVPVGQELIVVGEISGSRITTGETFIISNLSEGELLSDLQTQESTTYWLVKVIAFIMFFAGISAILRPIVALADFIPFAGGLASTVAGAIGFVASLIIVALLTVFVKFWILFVVLCILGIVGLMGALAYIVMNKRKKKKE
jgi:hypothetical protein